MHWIYCSTPGKTSATGYSSMIANYLSTPQPDSAYQSEEKAFTLVEILIVVVILGILASITILLVGTPQKESAQAAFITDLKSFAQSAILYHAKNGDFLEDASSGMLPAGFEDYVNPNSWTNPTPIGGVWDTELDSYGIKSALGVHFNGVSQTQDDAYMTDVDSKFDDGNLAAGAFRKIDTGRYYFIIKE